MNSEWRTATKAGDMNRVDTLLDAGVDINSLDEHGQTALMNAVYRGDVALTELLVQRGCGLEPYGEIQAYGVDARSHQ